jgi:ABC-type transport system involved in multi-copper enzyme maturation permease subunit
MKKIWVIATLTMREAIRDRILYLLLFFAIILIIASSIISKLTVGDEIKIIKDFGLTSISFFGVLISIFLGIGLLYKEIDKKTIYVIVSKPIERFQFIIGKFIGLLLVLFANWLFMSIIFLLLTVAKKAWDPNLIWALIAIYLEFILITAIAILFSSFSTPILSSIFSLCLYFTGHFIEGLKMMAKKMESAVPKAIVMVLYYLVPNLERFNLRGVVVHGDSLGNFQLLNSSIYAIIYASALLLLAIAIFQRRNFI